MFVGGDWGRKGLGIAIEALVEAPEWQLLVVGEGDRRGHEGLAERHGVGDRVRFLGREERPERTYNAADAFVFPTSYETFSLVSHEAAACGLPLLVTRVHGVDELLEPERNGWFIAREPDQVAERLRTLAADPALRRAMGEAAAQAASRYGWNLAVGGHLDLYDRLAARR